MEMRTDDKARRQQGDAQHGAPAMNPFTWFDVDLQCKASIFRL